MKGVSAWFELFTEERTRIAAMGAACTLNLNGVKKSHNALNTAIEKVKCFRTGRAFWKWTSPVTLSPQQQQATRYIKIATSP
jgi:hypothetical protein